MVRFNGVTVFYEPVTLITLEYLVGLEYTSNCLFILGLRIQWAIRPTAFLLT